MLDYKPVLSCTEQELTEEIEGCLPLFCRRWILEMQRTEGKADQTKVLKEFLRAGDNGTMFPNFASLVMILMAKHFPLERSYTHLELVCAPRRNKVSLQKI